MLLEKNNHEVFGGCATLERKISPPRPARAVYNRAMTPRSSLLFVPIAVPLGAQWLKLPDKSIPRTKDGKPDLMGPTPVKTDGKPDLAGIWIVPGPTYLQNLPADSQPGRGAACSLGPRRLLKSG